MSFCKILNTVNRRGIKRSVSDDYIKDVGVVRHHCHIVTGNNRFFTKVSRYPVPRLGETWYYRSPSCLRGRVSVIDECVRFIRRTEYIRQRKIWSVVHVFCIFPLNPKSVYVP